MPSCFSVKLRIELIKSVVGMYLEKKQKPDVTKFGQKMNADKWVQ